MKRRAIAVLLAVLLLASGLALGCGQKLTTYHDSEHGYTIKYPSKWEVSRVAGDVLSLSYSDYCVTMLIDREHTLPAEMSMAEYSSSYVTYRAGGQDGFELISLTEVSQTDYQLDYELTGSLCRSYLILRGDSVFILAGLSSTSYDRCSYATRNSFDNFDRIYRSFRTDPAP
jgi:hypothetical protein